MSKKVGKITNYWNQAKEQIQNKSRRYEEGYVWWFSKRRNVRY